MMFFFLLKGRYHSTRLQGRQEVDVISFDKQAGRLFPEQTFLENLPYSKYGNS